MVVGYRVFLVEQNSNAMISNIIKFKEDIISGEADSDIFHIAFGVDEAFIKPAGVNIHSIVANNQIQFFHFHLLITHIKDFDLNRLKQIPEKNCTITLYWFDEEIFKSFQEKDELPISMYYRLLAPEILKDITDKVLYLDADMLCLSEISKLKGIEFGTNVVCAVHDDCVDKGHIKSLNLNTGSLYFNSGMLFINIPLWISNNVFDRFLVKIEQRNYLFPDQDVLNIILQGSVIYLPKEFNFFSSQINDFEKNIVFLHFAGTPKPWKSWCKNADFYLEFYRRSPWKDIPIELPVTYKQSKMYSKKLLSDKNYIAGFSWYVKYLIGKFIH
ncbi:hypothetical protein KKI90_15380 [Xenorhabdus bovienii]|nr:glycosyltransferase [Xenorhabdus bovienii]MDE9478541.1 hypothetical protein [Xenorhabdus bovienii]MDE9531428.1 hypothetical protein [Xenorhabdus bovienii]